jgi:site-specific recombinase XerD
MWLLPGGVGSRIALFTAGNSSLPYITPKITIERAVNAFHATHAKSSAFTTQRMYRYLMNRFIQFSESKGYVLLEQWGPMDVREFRTSWGVLANTATKNMTILKSFFEFSVSNEWLDRNPGRLVKELRNRNEKHSKERIPFSDEELARMFEACETKYGKT